MMQIHHLMFHNLKQMKS